MAELPRSLPEFEARFPDEAACARWLLAKRWPDGFRRHRAISTRRWASERVRACGGRRGGKWTGLDTRGSPIGLAA